MISTYSEILLLNIIQQLVLIEANHVEYSQKSNSETLKYASHNLIKNTLCTQDFKTCCFFFCIPYQCPSVELVTENFL